MKTLAIIGGGPAGLRAAETAIGNGIEVTVYDAKPSTGRKLLVAGRGGLNITKSESFDLFMRRYSGPDLPAERWREFLAEFTPDDLRAWAAGLGIETFAASTGRVYPREMKAAPLLRRWIERLKRDGVRFVMNHRFTGLDLDPLRVCFGTKCVEADAVVLALGGASWPRTGSDAGWVPAVESQGIAVAPFQPSNCGWECDWKPEFLAVAEGLPLKNIAAVAGSTEARGELLITRYGLEGGIIYQLGTELRETTQPIIRIDLKPGNSTEQLVRKMGPVRRNFISEAAARWKLPTAARALLDHHPDRESWTSPEFLAEAAKSLPITLTRPRPIAEAISSAGGVCWSEIDENLMLRKLPGVFVAGEMIDWDAPTGGYLMQGCFASGTQAGRAAREWAAHK
jgi:uncharacterized flavoprotein (TIGR03862 family)